MSQGWSFKISFIFMYKAFNNISVCRQDSVRACGDGAGQVCHSSRPKAHRHEEECTEELVGVCDTVKDLRCKRVKEEEYEDLDFEECDDKEEC